MDGTVKVKEDNDEKEIFDINKKRNEPEADCEEGYQEDEADDESSNKDEEFLKTHLFIDEARDLIIYEGPNSASLSSLHRVHFASTGSVLFYFFI